MDALKRFTIPLKGIKIGLHEFQFEISSDFFSHFEGSPITDGHFMVNLELDKRPEMLVLDFDFDGTIPTSCDRCLADIQLPVYGQSQMVVKFSEEERDTDEEIIFLPWDAAEFNVAQYIYENIILALPLINIYDCEEDEKIPCNLEMLEYLKGDDGDTEETEESEQPEEDNPIWSELKKKFNNDN